MADSNRNFLNIIPTGEQGPVGPQGVQGIQGIQGIQGVQGIPGPIVPLGDLTDVTITSPNNQQYLKYNGTEWVNQVLGFDNSGNGAEIYKFSVNPPTFRKLYSNTANISIVQNTNEVTFDFTANLNNLSDVTITTPQNNDILVYNSGIWSNKQKSIISFFESSIPGIQNVPIPSGSKIVYITAVAGGGSGYARGVFGRTGGGGGAGGGIIDFPLTINPNGSDISINIGQGGQVNGNGNGQDTTITIGSFVITCEKGYGAPISNNIGGNGGSVTINGFEVPSVVSQSVGGAFETNGQRSNSGYFIYSGGSGSGGTQSATIVKGGDCLNFISPNGITAGSPIGGGGSGGSSCLATGGQGGVNNATPAIAGVGFGYGGGGQSLGTFGPQNYGGDGYVKLVFCNKQY